jgi:hypothetical protein
LQKLQDIVTLKENFEETDENFTIILLMRYKILKIFIEHNETCKEQNKKKMMKQFSLIPMKHTFHVDYLLYHFDSIRTNLKKYLLKYEEEVYKKLEDLDKARFIIKKLFNFKKKRNEGSKNRNKKCKSGE